MSDEAPKKSSGGHFLKSPQSRVFLAIGLAVVLVVAAVFLIKWHENKVANEGAISVSGAPPIHSTPGAGSPSEAYVKAQMAQNTSGEESAQKTATAFVPTITRAGFVGNPSQFGAADAANEPKNCNINKVVVAYRPNPESCTPKNLQLARETGVTVEELMCQGCACPALKAAGYTIGDLKKVGLTAEQLHDCGFGLQALKDAGFSAADLKAAGFSAAALKAAGFTAGELKDAGFSAADLKAAGFAPNDLKDAGYAGPESSQCDSPALQKEISAGSESGECSAASIKKDRASNMSATALREKGCSMLALKAGGYSAGALRAAGFSALQLRTAGFNATDLKAAGFSATELKNACFSVADLKAAGFSASELKAAGFTAGELKTAGFSAAQLKDAGFSAAQLKDAGYSAAQLKSAGFTASQLKDAGFSAGQLASAGFSASQLKDAGFPATDLRNAGENASELRKAGATPTELAAAGFTKGDLLRGGYKPAETGYPEAPTPAVLAPVAKTALPPIGESPADAKLAQFEKAQQASMNAQQREDHIRRMEAAMNQMAQKLMTAWSNPADQQLLKAPEKPEKNGANGGGANSAAMSAAAAAANEGPIFKAGSVLFAVIETSINSNENSPIMANIVTGPLRGSKLLGSFVREHTSLLISFSVLSDPDYPHSLAVNAVAIDPNTARTALTGDVDNHYMLRYGSLFAASFLQGISQAVMNNGVSSDCLFGGFGCTLTQTPLNTNQQIAVGLGNVGQAYSQHMGENYNLPPTVRIAAGTGIGVLLMGDLTLPKPVHVNNIDNSYSGIDGESDR